MIASSTEKIKSARTLAFEALYEIFEKNAYANLTIQSILRWCPLKKEERHLLTELIYGVCRKYNYCLWLISLISDRPMFKIHPAVRILFQKIESAIQVGYRLKIHKRHGWKFYPAT